MDFLPAACPERNPGSERPTVSQTQNGMHARNDLIMPHAEGKAGAAYQGSCLQELRQTLL